MKSIYLIAALCLAPNMAVAGNGAKVLSAEDARSFAAASGQKLAAEKPVVAAMAAADLRAALTASLSGRTKIIYQDGYGVYVEYTAPDGSDRMWFPRNADAVKGKWTVRDTPDGPRACFLYFNSHDVVTGQFEPNDCVPAEQTLSGANVLDVRSGDVFGLMAKLPYIKSDMDVPQWPKTDPDADKAK